MKKVLVSLLFVSCGAFAQAPAAPQAANVVPAAIAVPSPAVQPVVDVAPAAVAPAPATADAVAKVQKAVDQIPVSLAAWMLALIGILVELAMRFFPSVNPRSLFILAGNICGLVGEGFIKISKLLDLIVQNLKKP